MKSKHIKNVFIILFFGASNSVLASQKSAPYIDISYSPSNTVELSPQGILSTVPELESSGSNSNFSLSIGYDLGTGRNFIFGFEAEYTKVGDSSHSAFGYNGEFNDANVISLLVSPKYYLSSLPIYIGAFAGIGVAKYSIHISPGTGPRLSMSETDFSYQYGISLGYVLTENVILNTGWESLNIASSTDFGDIDYNSSGLYVGATYKF
ncbi:outer membrane protein [Vibrio mediterranei]|uniref:Outer membrane protein beta-barrel domain-containing protein n=1 Tax=Vibrio mediterranei TaxID=689 RepID=A0AAN1FM66_9VIBR|nr:outer membrane beta-barrel protein [Vibrio mediterranei]ASI93206.1 hypothetical protein BSZ05_26050 [Vibrio mediterranei]